MSSAKQLNVFEESPKPQPFTEEDIPQAGRLFKYQDQLFYQPSPGEKLWQSLEEERFLRWRLPRNPEFDQIIATLQERRAAYLKSVEEAAKKRRFNQ